MKNPMLYQVLDEYDKNSLLTMCRDLHYRGYSKLNKLELTKYMARMMLQPEEMSRRLCCLSNSAYALFERAVAAEYLELAAFSEEECAAADCLKDTMYVGTNIAGTRLYVCEDVKAAFANFDASSKFHALRKQVSWLLTCIKLSSYLYTVVPEEVLSKLYFRHPDFRKQRDEAMRLDMLAMALIPEDILLTYYSQLKENIIPGYKETYISQLWFADYEQLLIAQGNKPFYIRTYEEISDFGEHGYLRNTPSCTAMRKFLIDSFALKPFEVYNCLSFLWEGSALGGFPNRVLKALLDQTGLRLSEKQLNKIISLYCALHNNTRTFINRGHTPSEMSRIKVPSSLVPGIME